VLFFFLSLSLYSLLFLHTIHTRSQSFNIYLQNILVLINLNHINPEFSGPNLNYNLVIKLTASRTFWSKIKQLLKYLTKVQIQSIILFYHSTFIFIQNILVLAKLTLLIRLNIILSFYLYYLYPECSGPLYIN